MTTISDYLRDLAEELKHIDAETQEDYEDQQDAVIEEYTARIKELILRLFN